MAADRFEVPAAHVVGAVYQAEVVGGHAVRVMVTVFACRSVLVVKVLLHSTPKREATALTYARRARGKAWLSPTDISRRIASTGFVRVGVAMICLFV